MHRDSQVGLETYLDSTCNILCAGRDRLSRKILAEALQSEGMAVSEASDTAEVLDRVARTFLSGRWREPLDFVIADARHDGLQALEPIASLRKVDWATPILIIVPSGDDELLEEAKRLGAAAIIEAPFRIPDLVRLLRTLQCHLDAAPAMPARIRSRSSGVSIPAGGDSGKTTR